VVGHVDALALVVELVAKVGEVQVRCPARRRTRGSGGGGSRPEREEGQQGGSEFRRSMHGNCS
jgi:hypothetical protein